MAEPGPRRAEASNTSPIRLVSPGMTSKPDERLPQFAVRCITAARAAAFRDHLLARGVVVEGVEDKNVLLRYGGTLAFVTEIACAAVMGHYAAADEMIRLLSLTEEDEESEPVRLTVLPTPALAG